MDIMVSGNQNPEKMMNSSRGFETRTWCMCHCISVIIYSDTLMLTGLARDPFTECAFNFAGLYFAWRQCISGGTVWLAYRTHFLSFLWLLATVNSDTSTRDKPVALLKGACYYFIHDKQRCIKVTTWRDATQSAARWWANPSGCRTSRSVQIYPVPFDLFSGRGNTHAHTDAHLDIQERW